jgi:hypothetical protein
MLFLYDSKDLDFASFAIRFGAFVPPGHVFSATRSPGSKNMQHDLLTSVVGDRYRFAILQRRKRKIRKGCAIFESMRHEGKHEKKATGNRSKNARLVGHFHDTSIWI